MPAKPIRVEWASVPDEWMVPAGIVFQRALHQSCPVIADDSDGSLLVIHISAFCEFERPLQCKGIELPSLDAGTQELVADPMIHIANSTPLLKTKCITHLLERNLAGYCASLLAMITLMLEVLDPWHTFVSVPGSSIEIYKRNAIVLMAETALMLVGMFIVAHTISKHLLKMCLITFHAVVIVLYASATQITVKYEVMTMLQLQGKLHGIDIFAGVLDSVTLVMVTSMAGFADAILMRVRFKALLILCLLIGYTQAYWIHRDRGSLSNITICMMPGYCAPARAVYMSTLLSQLLFLSRILTYYLKGCKYAVLQPKYMDPHWNPLKYVQRFPNLWRWRTNMPDSQNVCRFSLSQDQKTLYRRMTSQIITSKCDDGSSSEASFSEASKALDFSHVLPTGSMVYAADENDVAENDYVAQEDHGYQLQDSPNRVQIHSSAAQQPTWSEEYPCSKGSSTRIRL